MNKFLGITLVIIALAIAITPSFTECPLKTGDQSALMPCQQSARAEMVIGAPLAAVGTSIVFIRRKSALLSLGIIGIVLGVAAILIPNPLIGVCPSPTHQCNTLMRPSLDLVGTLAIIGSLGALVMARKAKD